jgi:DNA-binding transcriptional ArsR family regulator
MDTDELVVDAFRQLDINAQLLVGAPKGTDLALELEGLNVELLVERKSLVTDDVAARLVGQSPGQVLFVVADRVTESARKLLTSHNSGYLDLRGRLALRTGTILIDAEVEPVKQRADRVDALSGKAGLEIAVALLMEPGRGAPVRELARELGRSPSTVSEVLKALRQHGLVDESNRVVGTDLFWAVADRWSTPQIYVAHLPDPRDSSAKALRLGLDDDTGWSTVGSLPASGYGAPVVAREDELVEFYVPDAATARRAVTLLGAAPMASSAKASIQVAPVPAALTHRTTAKRSGMKWPAAHPLFVALDLAQDQGRGREILDGWTPTEGTRVW